MLPDTVPELQAALTEALAARDAAVKELTTMRRQLTNAQTALDDAQKVRGFMYTLFDVHSLVHFNAFLPTDGGACGTECKCSQGTVGK